MVGPKNWKLNSNMFGPDKRRTRLAQKRVGGPRLTLREPPGLTAVYALYVTNPKRSTQLLHPHSTSVPSTSLLQQLVLCSEGGASQPPAASSTLHCQYRVPPCTH